MEVVSAPWTDSQVIAALCGASGCGVLFGMLTARMIWPRRKSDPLIDVRWVRIGEWAGDERGVENECRGLTMREFVARLARVTKRGDHVEIVSVTLRKGKQ